MKINVPYFGQNKPYSCGPAVLRMVFCYFDLLKSEEEIIKETVISGTSGVSREEIKKIVSRFGFFSYQKENASFEEVLKFLEMSLPVIVNFIEPSDDDGHYAVVVGFEDGDLILNDPWNGEGFRMSREAFEKNWRSGYESGQRWFMVVSPREILKR